MPLSLTLTLPLSLTLPLARTLTQALTGRATIRSVNPVFSEPVAAGIALDVLTERGFHASLDYIRETTPAYLSARPFDGFLAGIGDHAQLKQQEIRGRYGGDIGGI